jgi:lipopolysaccharide transport system ATP-binding protein
MLSDAAILLQNVSKVYHLHGNRRDQFIHVMGLDRIGFKPRTPAIEFKALDNVSLDVPKGHRIGIIGRNGAGKTTLLKLICGNYSPTSGRVLVNGNVQALMSVGLGFHPEYTGRENVEASLQYNGLNAADHKAAVDGIIDFCELGEFLDQPFKTYSLGMQARLMFAAATAVRPDILIVDEVLGAGDAYFVAKSKRRVEQLVQSGCTMLLVSHSMGQILELCKEVIWMENGSIRMQGDAFMVVKAYEEQLYGPIRKISTPTSADTFSTQIDPLPEPLECGHSPRMELRVGGLPHNVRLQTPNFLPHGYSVSLPSKIAAGFAYQAPGGISRWDSEIGLKVTGFSIVTESGVTNALVAMKPAKLVITLIAEESGAFNCCYGIALHDHLGVCVTRIFSPGDAFDLRKGEQRQIEMLLNPCQLGPGEYTVGISIAQHAAIEKIHSSPRYDLLSRSFLVKVELPESLCHLEARFFHSAEWSFGSVD